LTSTASDHAKHHQTQPRFVLPATHSLPEIQTACCKSGLFSPPAPCNSTPSPTASPRALGSSSPHIDHARLGLGLGRAAPGGAIRAQ
jgi:hypothetical protein